jgi:tRNA A37 threonylcarbamoyladenosine modification protein TsaB
VINDEFTSKGFDITVPTMLFNGEYVVDALEDEEIIALSISIYNFLTNADINMKANINPNDYFTDKVLTDYKLQSAPKEDRNPVVVFEECRKIDANNYWVYLTAEQLYTLRKNRNVQYFQGIQRMAKIVTLPNGMKIKKINTNPNGIKKMQSRLRKHNLRPTSIAFALLLEEGKDPIYQFTPEYKSTGSLMIKTDFDSNSEHYAPLIIPDGFHRREAYADTFGSDGKKIKEGLGVHIYLMTVSEAKQFVSDVFERNETDEEYKESLNNEDNSLVLIENVISNSNILRDNVVNTITEYKEFTNSLTYIGILKDVVKDTEINTKDEVTCEKEGRKIAKVIDAILGYMISSYFENDIEKMKNTSLLAPNSFAGYLAIANLLKDNSNFRGISGEVADKLINEKEIISHKLKLNEKVKENEAEKIYRYFENIAKEVI